MSEPIAATPDAVEGRAPRPRRKFLARALGLGAVAAAGPGMARTALALAAPVDDPAILQFALNLEYLEAEFYTFAVTGGSIEALGIATTGLNTGAGNPGPIAIKANPHVPFATPAIQQYATEIAVDEQRHVIFFRDTLAALGVQPVARPALDLLKASTRWPPPACRRRSTPSPTRSTSSSAATSWRTSP